MYDVTIIGGGPAGLTAMLYCIQKGLNSLLISKDLGGKTSYRLALPWILDPIQGGPGVLRGMEMVNYIRSELSWLTYNCLMEPVDRVVPTEDGFIVKVGGHGEDTGQPKQQEVATRTVIVATGTHQVPLDIPGEKEYFLRGLAYSSLSYAPLFRDRAVAVVGEGELAIRSAAELATAAKQVSLVCSHTQMFGLPLGMKLTRQENVKILDGYLPLEIKGSGESGEGFANALVVRGPADQIEELAVDGIFIERGLVPNSGLVAGLVQTDPAGRITVDATNCTDVPGIFAAGDVTNLYGENLLVATGEGAKAALSAYDYLLPEL
jgi:alkyl hydroperoxide reductase subunit F